MPRHSSSRSRYGDLQQPKTQATSRLAAFYLKQARYLVVNVVNKKNREKEAWQGLLA
jgi:hypothetical protein